METCALQARAQLPAGWTPVPDDGVVAVVRMAFTFPLTKRGRPRVLRADADNLGKSILDALQGIVWEDDRMVRAPLPIVLGCAEDPGVDVNVAWVAEAEWTAGDGEGGAGLVAVIDAAMSHLGRGAR
jgi:hypothetical protein